MSSSKVCERGFPNRRRRRRVKTFGAGASFSQEMRFHLRPTANRHGSRLVPHPAGLAEGGLKEAAAESHRHPFGLECRTWGGAKPARDLKERELCINLLDC